MLPAEQKTQGMLRDVSAVCRMPYAVCLYGVCYGVCLLEASKEAVKPYARIRTDVRRIRTATAVCLQEQEHYNCINYGYYGMYSD